MAYRTIQRVSVPNFNLFGSMKTEFTRAELWGKEVSEFSITLYVKMNWWAKDHGCCNINVKTFSKLSTAITLAFIGIST